MTEPSADLFSSPSAAARLAAGVGWLLARGPTAEVLVVGHTIEAARELCHAAVASLGASFGWYRTSFGRLARELAPTALDATIGSPIDRVGADAVAARAVHELLTAGGENEGRGVGRYAGVADTPGFVRALTDSLRELRLGSLSAPDLEDVDLDLASLLAGYEARLAASDLSDRAGLVLSALAAVTRERGAHPWVGLPVLFHDVAIETELEGRLARGLIGQASASLITVPAGDARTLSAWAGLATEWGDNPDGAEDGPPDADPGPSLERVHAHLFQSTQPLKEDLDETVTLFSAPGEGRECVEIARQLLQAAGDGLQFDHAAVLLRSAGEYRPHLEEALGRAGIPAYFAFGARRPDPAGRAFLALLRCRLEGFAAVRFAEYVSIGQVTGPTSEGAPQEAQPSETRWVPTDEIPAERYGLEEVSEESAGSPDPDAAEGPVSAGALRVPRRWEKLLVEAAVVGGLDRWRNRLAGLENQLAARLAALVNEDDPATERVERDLRDLEYLRDYALPLLEEMDGWPPEAPWSQWLDALGALATRALRAPERVLELLARLAPLGPVGPVTLGEVTRVLRPHLLEVTRPPASGRYGKVFVGAIEEARGRSFDLVFVPGLADHLFPRPVKQEPILSDTKRRAINGESSDAADVAADADVSARSLGLPTSSDRVAHEQFLLRLAVGAASERVVLSFPRMDLARSRPRVPSYYALEAVRAGEGELPLMDEFQKHAAEVTQARVGWPAPEEPEDAIDEAEYDLAVLYRLFKAKSAETGSAHYLLNVNPYLRRQLRGRLRRWHLQWTYSDGLIQPSTTSRAAIDAHRPSERSFSATALQALASCPYKFYLYAVQRLRPRDEPGPIEEMDPLQKGGLVHEIQFRAGLALRDRGLLPVTPATTDQALAVLEDVLGDVAEKARQTLCPAIPRVWEDEIARIRADLRRWIREAAREGEWVPWKFELGFGLGPWHPAESGGDEERDPDSRPDPVALDAGLQLRGKIDLVESRNGAGAVSGAGTGTDTAAESPGALRITDHKTGRAWHARARDGIVIAGGEALQPVLYALAAEKLWPGSEVAGGGLYYCTSDGGFVRVDVPLDDEARRAAEAVTRALETAFDDDVFEGPAFAAKPKPNPWGRGGACNLCDFRPVCGPHELIRTGRKPPIAWLESLRAER
jgi:hypothetical protein